MFASIFSFPVAQAVATDIIEAAGIAYVRALSNAARFRATPPCHVTRGRRGPWHTTVF